MANFDPAFDAMIENEGGFVLHEVDEDRGGLTYAGISRKYHANWEGWQMLLERRDDALVRIAVKNFYYTNFWHIVKGEKIDDQAVANSLFDFAVNVSALRAVSIAQRIIGSVPDGIVGPETIGKLNACNAELFLARFAVEKAVYYMRLVDQLASQEKFLRGWLNRAFRPLKVCNE